MSTIVDTFKIKKKFKTLIWATGPLENICLVPERVKYMNRVRMHMCMSCELDVQDQEETVTLVSSQKQQTRSVSSAASYSHMTAVFNDVGTSPKKFQLCTAPPTLETSETITVVHMVDESSAVSSGGNTEITDTFAALNVAALHLSLIHI